MDNFEKLITGLVLFVITSAIAYLFRIRQLYVVSPKLFRHAAISEKGALCEIIAYNNGNQVEEEIQIELDPELKCELLAASTAALKLEGSTISIDRLHKNCEESGLLLIENGVFDSTKIISISSKETKGKVCKIVAEVPPNFAKIGITFAVLIGFLPAVVYAPKVIDSFKEIYVESQLKTLMRTGWKNLTEYYFSNLKQSYSDQEFPIKYIDQKREGNLLKLTYEFYNKSAVSFIVLAHRHGRSENPEAADPYFSPISVPPMSKQRTVVTMLLPSEKTSSVEVDFTISVSQGSDYISNMMNSVELASAP